MPRLEGEENRYLLYAEAREAPFVRRMPGHRYSAPQRCWLFPRQPGVVLALDRVFGRDNWEAAEDLTVDVAFARGRLFAPPQSNARVELEGTQLTVQCTSGDRELVKLVPGYRWSPAKTRWSIAALPLALDILKERFGRSLSIGPGVETYIELRRQDEARAVASIAASAAPALAPEVPAVQAPLAPQSPESLPSVAPSIAELEAPATEVSASPPTADSLRDTLAALTAALVQIDEKLDRLLAREPLDVAVAEIEVSPRVLEREVDAQPLGPLEPE
ncbi:MAG TPA: hypothetical protein VN697_02370, partial [Tepidiformaceae bacterium]|nr:hypothetical protein [Tepidiformaceae bacterium]